jgi:hypothetical protein
MFTKSVCVRFDRESHFLGRLTKLKQIGFVTYCITAIGQLAIRTEGLSDDFYLECFISGLNMPFDLMLACTILLHGYMRATLKVEIIMHVATLLSVFPNRPHLGPSPSPTQTLKFQKLYPT